MATIIISNAAYEALKREAAPRTFNSLAVPQGDGTWSIPVSGAVLKSLKEQTKPDEDFSATIIRRVDGERENSGLRLSVDNDNPLTDGQLRDLIDKALVKNPTMEAGRKARIIREIKRQAAVNPLDVHVKDGDFEFAIEKKVAGVETSITRPPGHLLAIDTDPVKFRFIGPAEKADLSQDKKFVTMSSAELEKLAGHPVTLDADGKPDNLTERDYKVLGATMAIRQEITGDNGLSPEAKVRILARVTEALDRGETAEQILADGRHSESVRAELDETLRGLAPRARRQLIKKMRRDNRKKQREHEKSRRSMTEEAEWLDQGIAAYKEVDDWLTGPMVLQKPPATMFHQMRQAVLDDEAFIAPKMKDPSLKSFDYEETWRDAAVFIVEHDWAAAFDGATISGADGSGVEFKLPADVCVFEFRISGRHIIAVTFEVDGRLYLQIVPLTSTGWLIPGAVYHTEGKGWAVERGQPVAVDDNMFKLIDLIGRQIRAIAIALDAEVATKEVIRAPHRLNHQRERRGKLPISSYHVVSLSRKSRAPRLERDPDAVPGTKKRLHFRRGHWRHYSDTMKVWIHWMLCGDPDLGFVDKHYKL